MALPSHKPASDAGKSTCGRGEGTDAFYKWSTVFDFLCERFPAVTHQEWLARFSEGLVLNRHGEAITEETPYTSNTLIHYYRRVPKEPELPFKAQVL